MFFIELPDEQDRVQYGLFVIEGTLDEESKFIHVIGPQQVRDLWAVLPHENFYEVEGPARALTADEQRQIWAKIIAEDADGVNSFWHGLAATVGYSEGRLTLDEAKRELELAEAMPVFAEILDGVVAGTITAGRRPARLTSIFDLNKCGFGVLGTLGGSFDSVNDKLLKKAAAVVNDSQQPAPVANPAVVVPRIAIRKADEKAFLLKGEPVAIRTLEAWTKLQAAATDAGVSPLHVMVFGVDADKYPLTLWTGDDSA